MSGQDLITAVVVGAVVGATGHLLVCRRRRVPWWLPLAAGVAAAVLATVLSWMADPGRVAPSVLEIAVQVFAAVAGVTIVAVTAVGSPPHVTPWQRSGKTR
ncbi:hypothetical protein Ait01nite_015980 [Actinoplanes italicus]|uniref:Uncharacterized protein n=1 Tax=Actinoplanes italicus TaxID=113567 RepID=A0A2T0KHW7_9ACTN|nr:GlsB/YeaQ/YmgE family stress response membrane protein [Actinoplanes italicus]PRX23034.1 hypothetical protein CLV67_104562 [Actinoplanes italicus]GIE28553.1 hypothetical protein Ait01nite_015980 [Actinoplanes italicus]